MASPTLLPRERESARVRFCRCVCLQSSPKVRRAVYSYPLLSNGRIPFMISRRGSTRRRALSPTSIALAVETGRASLPLALPHRHLAPPDKCSTRDKQLLLILFCSWDLDLRSRRQSSRRENASHRSFLQNARNILHLLASRTTTVIGYLYCLQASISRTGKRSGRQERLQNDAQAIAEAASRPTMRCVPL